MLILNTCKKATKVVAAGDRNSCSWKRGMVCQYATCWPHSIWTTFFLLNHKQKQQKALRLKSTCYCVFSKVLYHQISWKKYWKRLKVKTTLFHQQMGFKAVLLSNDSNANQAWAPSHAFGVACENRPSVQQFFGSLMCVIAGRWEAGFIVLYMYTFALSPHQYMN